MLKIGDKAVHTPSGHEIEITKVGAVTYGVYDPQYPGMLTVPYQDVQPIGFGFSDGLSFGELRTANDLRNNDNAGGESTWTLADWGNALAGETGELCNFIKKSRRTLPTDPSLEELKERMAHELADIVTYADLIASKIGVDLGQAIREKFNIVSKRRNSSVEL